MKKRQISYQFFCLLIFILLISVRSRESVFSQVPTTIPAPAVFAGARSNAAGTIFSDPRKGRTEGLYATVYSPNANQLGYHRWMIRIARSDGRIFPADGQIRVQLEFKSNYRSFDGPEATLPRYGETMLLEQGKLESATTFLMPEWSPNLTYRLRFYSENGELRGLNSEWQYPTTINQSPNPIPTLWVHYDESAQDDYISGATAADRDIPALRNSRALTLRSDPPQWMLGNVNQPNYYSSNVTRGLLAITLASRLPDNWLDYSSYSWIWIPLDILESLPAALANALRKYIEGGGVLVVTRWNNDYGSKRIAEWIGREHPTNVPDVSIDQELFNISRELGQVAEFGFGRIVCLEVDRLRDLDATRFGRISTLIHQNIDRQQRLGVSEAGEAGENYWSWMITRVGKPPVWLFGSMIAFFAAIAGPALLIWTNRIRRQTWLLILFPSLAVVATSLLFGYAIFRDGFATTTRVRSFTLYDPGRQAGFAWSRQTLFSGMPPREGMTFRNDSEVTPIETAEAGTGMRSSSRTDLNWNNNRQQFTSLLNAREQKQFLIRHPVHDVLFFEILPSDDTEAMRVRNISADPWRYGFWIDAELQYWTVEDVPPGQEVKPSRMNADSARQMSQKILREFQLSLPEGLEHGQRMSMTQWFGSSRYYRGVGGTANVEPLMESHLSKWAGELAKHRPKSFILFLKSADHIDRPISNAHETDSLHIVAGQW